LRENQPVNPAERKEWVVEQARALGFDLCGVARAEEFPELAHLAEWLARGYAGEMRYLEDPRRRSPARVLEAAHSIIVCGVNYNTSLPYSTQSPPEQADDASPRGWISRYAWGDDYHDVLLEKLEALIARMRAEFTESFEALAYVDTGPIVERIAARHAGLGWLAKNTCLIHAELGSWLFLGVIVTTLELAPSLGAADGSTSLTTSVPPPDLCGNCRLCIEACPTGAIVAPYVLDARRCISYLTIELRGSIPEEMREPMGRHVFGCDICQDVCPWNRQAAATKANAFLPRPIPEKNETRNSKLETRRSFFAPELEWLISLSETDFREAFRGSAVRRTKRRGLVRNACVALGNSGVEAGTPAHARIVARLEALAACGDALIAEHARWALARLQG
jgi:epoxyqueuosine reductase